MTVKENADDGLRTLCELPRGGELYFLLGVTQGTAPQECASPGRVIATVRTKLHGGLSD